MISYEVYKLVHLLGILGLFVSLGAMMVVEKGKARWTAPFHGIALLLILVAGFGMLARLGIHALPGWVLGKLAIWLFMGGAIVIAKRKLLPAAAFAVLLVVMGGLAAWLAIWKP